jgi:hypothetical protein
MTLRLASPPIVSPVPADTVTMFVLESVLSILYACVTPDSVVVWGKVIVIAELVASTLINESLVVAVYAAVFVTMAVALNVAAFAEPSRSVSANADVDAISATVSRAKITFIVFFMSLLSLCKSEIWRRLARRHGESF